MHGAPYDNTLLSALIAGKRSRTEARPPAASNRSVATRLSLSSPRFWARSATATVKSTAEAIAFAVAKGPHLKTRLKLIGWRSGPLSLHLLPLNELLRTWLDRNPASPESNPHPFQTRPARPRPKSTMHWFAALSRVTRNCRQRLNCLRRQTDPSNQNCSRADRKLQVSPVPQHRCLNLRTHPWYRWRS